MNHYIPLSDLKARLGIADTTDDAILRVVIEQVSRDLDVYCGRHFYVAVGTRVFTADRHGPLLVDDLLSVTSLKTDSAGDRSYATTWATTDYDLNPANALTKSPPHPYESITRMPTGNYSFPRVARGVQIVGKWGYYEVLERSATTLGAAITSTTATSITLSASPQVKEGQTLLIDSEQMFLSALVSTTGTVIRGVNGTTAATHLNAAVIDVYTYPSISEACLLQCIHEYQSKNAPGGVIGGGDVGMMRLTAWQPMVRMKLSPFRLRSV